MLSIFIPWHKTPLSPPLKMTIKVIYSPGIKVFYAGVVFGSLWYVMVIVNNYVTPHFNIVTRFYLYMRIKYAYKV